MIRTYKYRLKDRSARKVLSRHAYTGISTTSSLACALEARDERTLLSAIETLLKEQIHPEVRRYLRRLYLDATNPKEPT